MKSLNKYIASVFGVIIIVFILWELFTRQGSKILAKLENITGGVIGGASNCNRKL